jgi:hypothetical protein
MQFEMTNLYEKLYQDANDSYRCNRNSIPLEGLSHFVSMKGTLFDTSDVRLFVVGRAANGWPSLPCETAQIFGAAANRIFNDVGFQWIENTEGHFKSLHTKSPEGEKPYYLSSSPFWRVAFDIWHELSHSNEGEFFKRIAWSNLYKISPKEGGNPTNTMCKRQFEACKEILTAEILAYRPTHILMITDYDHWYAYSGCDFSVLFEDSKRRGSNYTDKKIFVEGTAKFALDGKLIPVIITCRPEGRKEQDFVEEALLFLRENN